MNRTYPGHYANYVTTFPPDTTGLSVTVMLDSNDGDVDGHDEGKEREPELFVNHWDEKEGGFSVSVSDNPEVVYGTVTVSPDELRKVMEWIKINKDPLLDHWNGVTSDSGLFQWFMRWPRAEKGGLSSAQEALQAVRRDHQALKSVPEEFRTPEVCLAAVRRNGGALQYVPKERVTLGLCFAAVGFSHNALHYVPKELITPGLCHDAVETSRSALDYVPGKFITAKLCRAAVQKYGEALRLVPEALKTAELCLAAGQNIDTALCRSEESKELKAFQDSGTLPCAARDKDAAPR